MKKLTRWIVAKCISHSEDIENPLVRTRFGLLEAVISIIINLVLFAIKLFLGLLINSVALVADAIHTLSDTGTSLVILIGFHVAKKPGDREHPFGHGRAEPITALIVAVILLVAGFELLKEAFQRIYAPPQEMIRIPFWIIIVLIITIIIKEWIARFARELGEIIKSRALEADFWHHRSDALSTLIVIAALIGAHYGLRRIDGIAGLLVGAVVIYSGYVIARDAMSPLLGERPSEKLLRQIEAIAAGVPGVQGVHDIIVHQYGQVRLVSLHIEVPENRPVVKLHDLSEKVESAVEEKLGYAAIVHIDPVNTHHERYTEIMAVIREFVEQDSRIVNLHDLRLVDCDAGLKVSFDINIDEHVSRQETADIVRDLQGKIRMRLPDVTPTIKAEPRYAYSNPPATEYPGPAE